MEERCICCGRIIPEGKQVCMICERKTNEGSQSKDWLPVFLEEVKEDEQQ